jgi:hypothetical protein
MEGLIQMAEAWFVQLIRLTLFSTDVIFPSEDQWKIATRQPEAEHRSAIQGGGRQYWGKQLNGVLQLTIIGNRLDFILSFDGEVARDDGLPVVDTWDKTSGLFLEAARRLLAGLAFPVSRMAFGGHFLRPASSRQSNYDSLARITKSLNLDFKRAHDLIFKVNWPVESKTVNGLRLNRITAFSAMTFSRLMVQPMGAQVTIVSPSAESLVHATSLEIDHSTLQDHLGPFETQQLIPIFNELVALASENLEAGEVV